MANICYAVRGYKNQTRYTFSQIRANIWAKFYDSEVSIAFNIPKCLIEEHIYEKSSHQNLDEIDQD